MEYAFRRNCRSGHRQCAFGEGTAGTTVINETSMPMVVLGAKDMIVAASPDGILVSDKHASSYLKPYTEQISDRPMYEEMIWGIIG